MATYHRGQISGKLGDRIYYNCNGKTYIRSVPKKRKETREPSPLQKANQARLPFIVRFLNPLSELIALGFKAKGPGSNLNKATSYNYRYALCGDYPDLRIDYPSVRITAGRLGRLSSIDIEYNGERSVKATWQTFPGYDPGSRIYLTGIHEASGNVFLNDHAVRRDDYELTIQLPDDYPTEGTVHFYIFCCDEKWKEFSNSQYAGGLEL